MLIKFNFVLVLYYSNDMQNRTICSDIMVHIHENYSMENYVSFLGKEQPYVNLWTKFFKILKDPTWSIIRCMQFKIITKITVEKHHLSKPKNHLTSHRQE